MPSTATITSFYTFIINTRPRVGSVNGNFSNFRGHLIAIDPNTATAAANWEYGFGAPEYRWQTAYMNKLDLSVTSTTSLILECLTAGEYHFRADSVSGFYIGQNGFVGYDQTDFAGVTSSAEISGLAAVNINASYTGTAVDVTGGSISLVTNGRPVLVGLCPVNATSGSSYLGLVGVTVAGLVIGEIGIKRNGSTVKAAKLRGTLLSSLPEGTRIPPGAITFIDFPAAGTNTYQLFNNTFTSVEATVDGFLYIATLTYSNVRFFAYEL